MNDLQLFDSRHKDLIKSMYFKGSTDEEFMTFLHVCKKTGLDPVLKQIHPVKRRSKKPDGNWGETITIQVSIDGYRLIADRTGNYSPGREATYTYNEAGEVVAATSYVKKRTADGTWHEVAATAFFKEYCPMDKDGSPSKFWRSMPHVMLAKCAEALALRKAFPGDLDNVYTNDEMEQADSEIIDTKPTVSKESLLLIEENLNGLDVYREKLIKRFGKLDNIPADMVETIVNYANQLRSKDAAALT